MKNLACAVVAALASGIPATVSAQVVAYTSFEEPFVVPGQYIDTVGWNIDHWLPNHSGEPILNYEPQSVTTFELGFRSQYLNTMASEGLTDGDYVGVTNDTSAVGSYPDGSNGFRMSDTEGQMQTGFDSVDLSGFSNPGVSVRYFLTSTDYEGEETVMIWVDTGGLGNIWVENISGVNIDDLGIEGR